MLLTLNTQREMGLVKQSDEQLSEHNVRSYQMDVRAQSAAKTRERILDAAVEIFYEQPVDSISLEKVALRSGYSVQTVIRRFGGKDGLFTAALERETKRLSNQRDQATAEDIEGALRILLDHYENVGIGILRMLAEENRLPLLQKVIELGREYHSNWCEKIFHPFLQQVEGEEHKRRLAQIIAITDVYTWKILFIDRGLTRDQTQLAMYELINNLTGGK